MSLSTPFIHRPVGTTLITLAVALAGGLAYLFLPVSPLPQVDYPTIQVSAGLPGASPETMASSVATPLERQFGRIAGITEMTSTSYLGSTSITLQFDLNRNIDAAARDVQAAINAAAGQLPANLPSKPNWRKTNPADAPILILAMTSDTYDRGRMYDVASSVLQQKLAQVDGVGQVSVGGGALPAVRVEVNPTALNNLGLGLEDVRTVLANANANRPKGLVENDRYAWSIAATDQLFKAQEYKALVVAVRNGAPVMLADVADVRDSVEDVHTMGLSDGKPAINLTISRQPGANIIDAVDRIRALWPELEAMIPPGMKLGVVVDRTLTIRASVRDVQFTMLISMGLVILVVFLFLRNVRATLIPSVAVPVSLIGTFAVMYLAGYSIDNLSLMAMTIATGFVVDDAIVVIENITRHIEAGMSPMAASLQGAREIGFTVVSMSTSLVAVFIPILLMSGYVGRLFREFAVTLSVAIGVSMFVSLTATPMMCAILLKPHDQERHGPVFRASERFFDWIQNFYDWGLKKALRFHYVTMAVMIGTLFLTWYLYRTVPTGLFPQQDTGRFSGTITADQDASSQVMQKLVADYSRITLDDPAVDGLVAFSGGGGGTNVGRMFVALKPQGSGKGERDVTIDQVMARLSRKLVKIPGADMQPQAQQDLRIGGRGGGAQYQYTLQGDDIAELNEWAPRVVEKIENIPGLTNVKSDQQNHGLEAHLAIDRPTAARLGLSTRDIDNTLYDAFGQRQVSTMYKAINQYHVVMEADPQFLQTPDGLKFIKVLPVAGGDPVPLSAITRHTATATPLAINHQSQFPCITISFNLTPETPLGQAVKQIEDAEAQMHLPASIQGKFAGTAQAFQETEANRGLLIFTAIAAVYIVLGVLYESYIHPLTILSTLPSAGVGALLALKLFHMNLDVISLIGIILLIGIVKKNAILMIDFAIDAERTGGLSPRDAIHKACLLRFRPITMTTMAALLGGLPLAIGLGVGSELRRPLGVAIVGGLIFSQALTLYTTPVVYLYMDWGRILCRRIFGLDRPGRRRLKSARSRDGFGEGRGHLKIQHPRLWLTTGLALTALACVTSCKVSDDYTAPPDEAPHAFKSATTQEAGESRLGWEWWRRFGDGQLSELEEAAIRANYDVRAAMARVAQARAATKVVGSQYYPVVTLDPSAIRARTSANGPGGRSQTSTNYSIPLDLSYEIDVWGRVKRSVEASQAQTLAAIDDVAVIRQTLAADIAIDYFTIRSLDAQQEILLRNVELYRRQVGLTQKQLKAGIVAQTDVLQAQTLLDSTLAQEVDVRRQRADLEHALAILLGKAPADLTVPTRPLNLNPPTVPAGLPSQLLKRRPDVAEAEANLVAASAQIGVAKADFYPVFRLTGAAGFESIDIAKTLDWESRVWSLGPSVSLPIFEGGKLTAQLEQAKARYEELLANYRTTVLQAVRDVEDALTDLHLRAEQAESLGRAVESAREYWRLADVQYQNGLVNYLQVIDADRTLLAAELAAQQTLNNRMVSAVLLMKALGGGWDEKNPELPWPTTRPAATQP